MLEHCHQKVGGQARLPTLGGQGADRPAGSMLRWEADSSELTLCSDSDISVGQGSSIMMW